MTEFSSLQEAMAVIEREGLESEAGLDALQYCMENGPPEIREKMAAGFRMFFPDVKPDYFDENGEPCYSAETLCKGLGMTMDELEAASERIPDKFRRNPCRDVLHRIH